MTYWSFEFAPPAQLLSMNDRMGWRKKAALTAEWREAVGWHAVAAKTRGMDLRAKRRVKVTLPVKSLKTRRDPHNHYPTIKVIVDAMTDAGWWPDDTAEYVETVEPEFWTSKTVLVEVTLIDD